MPKLGGDLRLSILFIRNLIGEEGKKKGMKARRAGGQRKGPF